MNKALVDMGVHSFISLLPSVERISSIEMLHQIWNLESKGDLKAGCGNKS